MLLEPIRFMSEEVAEFVMPLLQEAKTKKARFKALKDERANITEFFNVISGDPEVKREALRRQLRDNTVAFETEFGVKEKV